MSISFGAAAVGALASLVFTGMLLRRCLRVPRLATVALLCAVVGLTVALVAQAVGYHKGFGQHTFRAIQLGAQLVAPLALTWALAELTGKSLGSRFAARLALGALTVIGGVVLATDPLSGTAFSTSWPRASVYYQIIPNGILELIAGVTALSAVVAMLVAGLRARHSAGWRQLSVAVVAAAVASLVTDALRVKFSANSAYVLICLAASALAWYAARRASAVRLESLRSGGYAWDEDTGSFVRYHEDTGDFAYGADTGGFGRGQGDTDGGGWYADDTGEFRRDPADTDFSGWFRPGTDTGGFRAVAGTEGRDPGDTGDLRQEATDTGYRQYGVVAAEPDQARGAQNGTTARGAVAYVETGDVLPVADGYPPPVQGATDGNHAPMAAEDTSRLYGQIAIYTLLDEKAEEFERLAREVVEQVKTREPDTLVYVMHGVPAAPMQRILYAVYRDQPAFDAHERQPYIRQFEEEREPYVLATNVIELGVQHAKFTPPQGARRPARTRKPRPRSNGAR
jgi:quinol monooxygenase YgiN